MDHVRVPQEKIVAGASVIFLVSRVLALAAAMIHVTTAELWRRPSERPTTFLLYRLTVGFVGLVVFVGHELRPAGRDCGADWLTNKSQFPI
jgi:hypothetical protein